MPRRLLRRSKPRARLGPGPRRLHLPLAALPRVALLCLPMGMAPSTVTVLVVAHPPSAMQLFTQRQPRRVPRVHHWLSGHRPCWTPVPGCL